MDTDEFVLYSLKCREDFLNILSDLKEKNMEMIPRGEDSFYLKRVYEEYEKYLHKLYDDYKAQNNIEVAFEDITYDFLTTIKEQSEDATYITRDERCLHLTCMEYNIIVDIHKFSYELFSLNHNLREKDFFHGTWLTGLLRDGKTTIEEFRSESYYDIDNFNHITLPDDKEYLDNSKMIDIYLLAEVSDIKEAKDYDDFFSLLYTLRRQGYVDQTLYRYFITLEDVLRMKKGIIKDISYTIIICCIILSVGIFFAYEMIY